MVERSLNVDKSNEHPQQKNTAERDLIIIAKNKLFSIWLIFRHRIYK